MPRLLSTSDCDDAAPEKLETEQEEERVLTLFLRWSAKIGLGSVVALLVVAHSASAITTEAKQAIVVDAETGTVLYEKNARQQMAPSSMTKVMTAYVLFNALRAGQITLDTEFRVSEKARRRGGSTMWLEQGQKVSVEDLLKGLIVVSATIQPLP